MLHLFKGLWPLNESEVLDLLNLLLFAIRKVADSSWSVATRNSARRQGVLYLTMPLRPLQETLSRSSIIKRARAWGACGEAVKNHSTAWPGIGLGGWLWHGCPTFLPNLSANSAKCIHVQKQAESETVKSKSLTTMIAVYDRDRWWQRGFDFVVAQLFILSPLKTSKFPTMKQLISKTTYQNASLSPESVNHYVSKCNAMPTFIGNSYFRSSGWMRYFLQVTDEKNSDK